MSTPIPNQQSTKARDLVITRTFAAPRARVWQAWTDPEQVTRWWGPQYFTAPAATIDLRVGGKYHFCMRSPEGQDFWSTGVYQEITPMDRIVYTDSFSDADGSIISPQAYGMGDDFPMETVVTLLFAGAPGGGTTLTLRNAGVPEGPMREMSELGWGTSLDKLGDTLR